MWKWMGRLGVQTWEEGWARVKLGRGCSVPLKAPELASTLRSTDPRQGAGMFQAWCPPPDQARPAAPTHAWGHPLRNTRLPPSHNMQRAVCTIVEDETKGPPPRAPLHEAREVLHAVEARHAEQQRLGGVGQRRLRQGRLGGAVDQVLARAQVRARGRGWRGEAEGFRAAQRVRVTAERGRARSRVVGVEGARGV